MTTIEEMLIQKYGISMTPNEVAKELHSHPTHVRELCREGKIPAVLIGNRWRIPTAKLAAIFDA